MVATKKEAFLDDFESQNTMREKTGDSTEHRSVDEKMLLTELFELFTVPFDAHFAAIRN